MNTTTAVFTAATAITTPSDRKPVFESKIRAALEHARRLTAMEGIRSRNVAIAWEVVEELQVAQRQRRATVQSAFTQYCLANPAAPEARMYDV
ncbi:MAG: Calvin cycle protein CP12 [Nodosilinea sp.]